MAKANSSYGTPIDTPAAKSLLAAARGRWAKRDELAQLAGVSVNSARFYVRALYRVGRLSRRKVAGGVPRMNPYAYEYRLKGT